MTTSTDYDAPRGTVMNLDEDSIEELKARRTSGNATIDLDETDTVDGFELPGADLADLADGELTVAVVPMRSDEFRCSRCFLVHHRSQRVQSRNGDEICRECA
jgi:hypothetical protein